MRRGLCAVAVGAAGVFLAGCGGRGRSPSANAPQTVPPAGLVVDEIAERKAPVPVAFYPNGKIYGMQLVTRDGKTASMTLEGTYDDPHAVMAYYQRFYQDPKNAQALRNVYSHESAPREFYWRGDAYGPTGHLVLSVWASAQGFSRDLAKWAIAPEVGKDPTSGGDPKETMIWLAFKAQ